MSTRWVGPQRRQHVREELRRPTLRGRPTQVWAGGGDRCEPRSEEMGGRRELHRTGGLASSRLPERNLGNNHPNSLFFLPSQLCWASPPTDVPTPADSEGSVYATPSGQRPGTETQARTVCRSEVEGDGRKTPACPCLAYNKFLVAVLERH